MSYMLPVGLACALACPWAILVAIFMIKTTKLLNRISIFLAGAAFGLWAFGLLAFGFHMAGYR